MDSVVGRLEVMKEPALDVQRLARGCCAGETEGLIAVDMPAQCRGQIAVSAAGEPDGQMAVRAQRPQNVGPQSSPPDLDAEIAISQLEGTGELGNIHDSLRT